MRNFYRWYARVLIGLLGSINAVCAQEANLVANGGLEDADPKHTNRPAGFEPRSIGPEPATMTWESPGYKGRRCVAVQTLGSSSFGYWQTIVPVKSETTYTVSFYYRTLAEAPRAAAGNPLYNQGRAGGPNLELGTVPDDPGQAGKPTAWSDIGIALPPVGGLFLPVAAEWSRFQHTFVTRPGQNKLVLKLRIRCYAQKAWFDEISVTEGVLSEAARERDPLWTLKDTTPPAVFRPNPPPNTDAEPDTRIGVAFMDQSHMRPGDAPEDDERRLPNPARGEPPARRSRPPSLQRSGVDLSSAAIELDGRDVTDRARVTPDGLVLVPREPLSRGAHRARVRVSDQAGNSSNRLSWQFGVGTTLRNALKVGKGQTRLNGEPFFPIAIYAYACHPDDGRFRESHLAQAAAAGYNLVLNTIEKRQGLDKELAHGMMGTLNISAAFKDCLDSASAQAALFEKGQARFSDHPCVAAYWADDPENVENTEGTPMSSTSIEKLRHAAAALKQRHPDIPSIFAISNLPRLKAAMPYGDVLLSYRYAVPQYHPLMIYGWTIGVCRKMVPDKPLWFLSQAIDLGYGAHVKQPGFRPTPQEMRAMAFYSLVCGMQGYAIYANYLNEEDYPDRWAEVLEIGTRMRYLAPALAAGRTVQSAGLKASSHSGSVFHREVSHEGRHTLIAVNMSAGAVAVTWQFAKLAQAAALFEDRAMSRAAPAVCDLFKPWEVHLYQWQ